MGTLSYFLGIKVESSNKGIFLSQRNVNDLLKEYHLESCKTLKLPMDTHDKLIPDSGFLLHEPKVYQRLIWELIYLTINRPNITFIVHVLSKFIHCPTSSHYQAGLRVLRYLAGSDPLTKEYSLQANPQLSSLVILTLVGQAAHLQEDPPQVFVSCLVNLLYLGSLKDSL